MKRVLIVDDDHAWAMKLEEVLTNMKSLEIEVDIVSNCKQAMHKLVSERYNLAIVDMSLGPNGDEGACLLRVSSELKRETPVMVVSGEMSRENVLEGVLGETKRGTIKVEDIFLKRNFDAQEFRGRLETVLSNEQHALRRATPSNDSSIEKSYDQSTFAEPSKTSAAGETKNLNWIIGRILSSLKSEPLIFCASYALILVLVSNIKPEVLRELKYLWYMLPILGMICFLWEKKQNK